MGNSVTKCWMSQPSYARYQSYYKDNEPDMDNVIGSLLEIDPSLFDREEGIAKITTWLEEITPEITMSPAQLEISRWKCVKYWEAQHASDKIEKDNCTSLKLIRGSCVRFYFETGTAGSTPRLVIEHCGKHLDLKNHTSKTVPMWIQNLKLMKWRPFSKTKRSGRNDTIGCYNGALADDINNRHG